MNYKYWIGLSSIEQIDSRFILKLYEHFGDIEKAYNASKSELSSIEGLSVKKAENFLKKRDELDLDKVYDRVVSNGIKFYTYEDNQYSSMLKEISDPPAVLYYKGDLESCNLERTVGFVGSRRSTRFGGDAVRKVIKELAGTDICVVSGLAAGIDTIAHTAALDNGIKTIGVIASGFDFVYPASNKKLYERIENGGGTVVTEYYPTFEPLRYRFPQRNRIVSGLSKGVVVAEAALRSGALITANLALEQGRELLCIPGLITNPNTAGVYKLIKDGAGIVTCAEDILNAFNWELLLPETKQNQEIDNLDVDEKKILYTINIEPKTFDEIQAETKINTEKLLGLLTMLELKSLITQTADDRYKKE